MFLIEIKIFLCEPPFWHSNWPIDAEASLRRLSFPSALALCWFAEKACASRIRTDEMGSGASKQTAGRLEQLKSNFAASEGARIEQTFTELASADGLMVFNDFQVRRFRDHPSNLILELESVRLSTFGFLCCAFQGYLAQRRRR